MVNAVHDFHQLVTVAPGLSIIEEVQMRNPGRSEIVEYATRFCILMAIPPYPVQNSDGSGNDIPCILRGDEQFFTGHIPVIRFVDCER